MSQCLNCHCELGPCDARVFCSEDCGDAFVDKEVVDMDLSIMTTRDLVETLKDRDDVQYIVNTCSSCNYSIAIDKGDLLVDHGEAIIIIVKGLF